MSGREIMKCPKCGGEMEQGVFDWTFRLPEIGEVVGDISSLIPFCCKNCGYVELYTREKRKKK